MELNEFQGNRWLETARWLGYEENFNLNTEEWGPSHVSCLSFKSLLKLRKLMVTGERERSRRGANPGAFGGPAP